MVEQLEKYIRERVVISEAELVQVVRSFRLKETAKGEILLNKGEVCKHAYFVNRGCIRMFYLQQDGSEATRFFAFDNQFGTALSSLITQQPSFEFIQSVESSQLLSISKEEIQRLRKEIPAWNNLYISILEMAAVINTMRLESFITMDAKQRYEALLKQNPQIVQRISNKIVAQYLGITQESLSRLKGK